MARQSQVLDVNASYAYLLWAREFAATSVVAVDCEAGARPCGFVTGFRRPERPDTLMVWQVAVDDAYRGSGIARRMLDELFDRHDDLTLLETTISDDNAASIALFSSFASARGMSSEVSPLFEASQFPDEHEAELLFRFTSSVSGTDPTR